MTHLDTDPTRFEPGERAGVAHVLDLPQLHDDAARVLEEH